MNPKIFWMKFQSIIVEIFHRIKVKRCIFAGLKSSKSYFAIMFNYRYFIVDSGLILLMMAEGRSSISMMDTAAPKLMAIRCHTCMDMGALSRK